MPRPAARRPRAHPPAPEPPISAAQAGPATRPRSTLFASRNPLTPDFQNPSLPQQGATTPRPTGSVQPSAAPAISNRFRRRLRRPTTDHLPPTDLGHRTTNIRYKQEPPIQVGIGGSS